jgi:hypothetical protein
VFWSCTDFVWKQTSTLHFASCAVSMPVRLENCDRASTLHCYDMLPYTLFRPARMRALLSAAFARGAPFGEHRRTLGSSQRAITECFGGRHGDSSRIVFVAICCSDFLSCIFLTCRSCEPVEGRGICHALQREPRASAARICGWPAIFFSLSVCQFASLG